jgi:hypothetical protein
VLQRHRRQRRARRGDVRPLVGDRHGFAALLQGVAPEGHHYAHDQALSVATVTALIVCTRFSAWSNTIDYGDSKTS